MLSALSKAEVGDDVYKDDPTLNYLQEKVAKMFNKEKALLTLSGTMSNLLSILSHSKRGESAIYGEHSHINIYEQGNISSIAGVFPIPIPENADSTISLSEAKSRILPSNEHFSQTTLLCMENTNNYLAGKALPLSFNAELVSFKEQTGLKTHLDGSRLFNAYYFHKASKPSLKLEEIVQGFDSVCFCLSKALRCPLGSVLLGSEEFIDRARRWRKALGGGFRQAGYVAAAALVSLEEAESVIGRDHLNAARLADLLEGRGVKVWRSDTNFVVFKPHLDMNAQEYVKKLAEKGVLAGPRLNGTVRMVFHENVGSEDVEEVFERIFSVKD